MRALQQLEFRVQCIEHTKPSEKERDCSKNGFRVWKRTKLCEPNIHFSMIIFTLQIKHVVIGFYISVNTHIWINIKSFFSPKLLDCIIAERNTPSPIDPDAIEVDINFQPDPTDLVLSSVPGGELFNPRKHKFSDEELKPQPMIKKARKVFVPDEQKVQLHTNKLKMLHIYIPLYHIVLVFVSWVFSLEFRGSRFKLNLSAGTFRRISLFWSVQED